MSKRIVLDILGPNPRPISIDPQTLVVAGYTGRDEEAVRHHIDELSRIGIAPPAHVPMLYQLDADLITGEKDVEIGDGLTTGEVEPIFIRHQGRWFLGIGSDLTNRDVEREDVKKSKAVCPKPIGATAVELPNDVASGGFDEVWDRIEATSFVDGVMYQNGSLSGLRRPSDLIPRVNDAIGAASNEDLVVFAGTLPLIQGTFRRGTTWEAHLAIPDCGTLIHSHGFVERS